MLVKAWAVLATAVAAALGVLHFANPYPLVQIPDNGHRLYFVPAQHRDAAIALLKLSGMDPFGTYTAGVRQTLFDDGVTVIATATDAQRAGISRVTHEPRGMAQIAKNMLHDAGIESTIRIPPEPELRDKLVVLKIPAFGWDIAYRVPGHKMPWPVWE